MARRGKRLSPDLRRLIYLTSFHEPPKEVARIFRVVVQTVYRIINEAVTGVGFDPPGRTPRISYKLKDAHIRFLIQLIQLDPTIYLDELQSRLEEGMDKKVSPSTIYRVLVRVGYTRKTITKAANERNENLRADYLQRISQYLPHERVYVDESRFDRRAATRTRAWAFHGERAFSKVFFLRGASYSVLPALGLGGVIHVKIVENAFNMQSFNEFIDELLERMNPYDPIRHNSHSVLIMDNCRIHKDPDMIARVQARGVRIEYLAPYSPDHNPIELCFSGMKAHFKRNRDRAWAAWANEDGLSAPELLEDMCYAVSARNAFGWFRKAGVL